MNYHIKLAIKNLSRYRLRTFVSLASIASGVLIMVFARAYVIGLTQGIGDFYVQYNTGHIRIVDREYPTRERLLTLNYPVDGFSRGGLDEMIGELESLEGVKMAIPRIKFGALATYEDELIDMVGWGVNGEKELKFTKIENDIAEGRMPLAGERGILMGSKLLEKLSLKVGDRVTIVYNTAFGSMGGRTFDITGKIESPLKFLNEKVFYLPLDTAQKLLYMEGESTEILLDTGGQDGAEILMPALKRLMEEHNLSEKYEILPWYESGTIFEFISLAKRIYFFMYLFILILASIVVFNTMVMIISERKREIGMMAAMGMGRNRILRLFMIEGGIMGIIGGGIGALLGGGLSYYLSNKGIDFSAAFDGMSVDFLMSPIIYLHFSFSNMLVGFFMGLLVVYVAVYIPARKAASLKPTEALRDL
ncbi:MAG: ABC transporter permease [Elusimicrobia bacterium]|nr:ABC transporter permease [Elusimicrobiota bacterium]